MTSVVTITADNSVINTTKRIAKYPIALKCYSPNQPTYVANTTLKTKDGLTYLQCFKDMGIDFVSPTALDNADDPSWQSVTGVSNSIARYLFDNAGGAVAPNIIINKDSPYNSGYASSSVPTNPENPGIDATGSNLFTADNIFNACIKPWIQLLLTPGVNDSTLARLILVEIANEPETMNENQLGQSRAWWKQTATQTSSDPWIRWLANQARIYSQRWDTLAQNMGVAAGTMISKVGGPSISIGGDPVYDQDRFGGHNSPIDIVKIWLYGYPGSRYTNFNGTATGDPQTLYAQVFTDHGYMAMGASSGDGGVASAGAGALIDVLPFIFFDDATPTVGPGFDQQPDGSYNLVTRSRPLAECLVTDQLGNMWSRGGWKYAQEKWRGLINAATNGTATKMVHTEQWPWSLHEHDGRETLSDLAMFVATYEAASIDTLAYTFAGGFVNSRQPPYPWPTPPPAPGQAGYNVTTWNAYQSTFTSGDPHFNGAPTGTGTKAPTDAIFSDYGGNLIRAQRYWAIKMAAMWSNHNGPKNLQPLTIVDDTTTVGDYDNPIVSTRGIHAIFDDEHEARTILINTKLDTTKNVTFHYQRTVSTSVQAYSMDQGTPVDTPFTASVISVNGDGQSITFSLPPGGMILLIASLSNIATGIPQNVNPPSFTGLAQVGQTLSINRGAYTQSPTAFSEQVQSADDIGFTTNVQSVDASTLTYQVNVQGKYLRIAEAAGNSFGFSQVTYSTVVGPVTAAPTSTPPVHRISASFKMFGTSDSQQIVVPNNPNQILVLGWSSQAGDGGQLNTPTVNGLPMTQMGVRLQGSIRIEFWYIVNPPIGTVTGAWTKTGSSKNLVWGMSVFSNVDQSTVFKNLTSSGTTQDTSASPKAQSFVSDTADLAISFFGANGGTNVGTPTVSGLAANWSTTQSTVEGGIASGLGAASDSVAWTPSGAPNLDWAILTASLLPFVPPNSVTYQQWRDSFQSQNVDAGCTLQLVSGSNEQRNTVLATIANGLDTQDTAYAIVNTPSLFPTTQTGRMQFVLTVPATTLIGGMGVIYLLTALGLPTANNEVINLYLDTSKRLGWLTSSGVLSAATLNTTTPNPLSAGDHLVELAWTQNGSRQLWVDGALLINDTGLSGATISAVPVQLNVGIDHYDAANTDPGQTIKVYGLQLASDPNTALTFPNFGALTLLAMSASLFTNPYIARTHRMTRGALGVMACLLKKQVSMPFRAAAVLLANIANLSRLKTEAVTITLSPAFVHPKINQTQESATVTMTAADTRIRTSYFAPSAAITFTGALTRVVARKLTLAAQMIFASLGMNVGTHGKEQLSLQMSTTPAMTNKNSLTRLVSAAISLVPSFLKSVGKPEVASVTMAPTQTKQLAMSRTVADTMTMAPTMSRFASLMRFFNIGANLTPTITANDRTTHLELDQTPTFNTAVSKSVPRLLSGLLSFQMTLSLGKLFRRLLAATVTAALALLIDSGRAIVFEIELATNAALSRAIRTTEALGVNINMSPTINADAQGKSRLAAVVTFTSTVFPGATVTRATSKFISLIGSTLRRS